MRPVLFRLRAELRNRTLSWLTLSLIVAVVAGASVATAAGARRTDTAYQRLVADRHGADVIVDNTPNPQFPIVDLGPASRLPQVTEAAPFKYFMISDDSANAFASGDGRTFGSDGLNSLKILQGRMSNPARIDEVVVDFVLADQRHLHVGDTYTTSFAQRPTESSGNFAVDEEHATQTRMTFHIVGIAAAPGQFPPQESRGYLADPPVYLTPAFYRAHADDFLALDAVLLRLAPGQETAFERAAAKTDPRGVLPLENLTPQARIVERSFHLQAVALWLAAVALALVGLLAVAQLLSRQTALAAVDYPVLRGLGMTPRQLWLLGVLHALVLGVTGAVLAIVPAILLSAFTPIGTARRAEPHPGIAVNVAALGVGVAATVALVVAVSVWPTWRAARLAGAFEQEREVPHRSSRVAETLSRAGAPIPMTVGVRMALQRGSGRAAIPVATSVAGAAIGVWAVVAALTFGTNLTHLLDHPHQYGVTWDAEVLNREGPQAVRPAITVAAKDPNVGAVAMLDGAPAKVSGQEADALVLVQKSGRIDPPVLAGRLPRGDDEIAVGTRTMKDLHLAVGRTAILQVWSDDAPGRSVKVVGRLVLSPGSRSFGEAADMGQGVYATPATIRASTPKDFEAPSAYIVAVRFRDGVDPAAGRAELLRRLGGSASGWYVQAPSTPETLVDFGNVRDLPLILGCLLAVIAAIGIAHLLITSIRRRRRDIAIFKTLGFVPAQVRHTVAWQATTLATVALVIGVPVGVVTGRLIWNHFADQVGVLVDTVTPVAAVLLVVVGAVAAANLIALAPARFAGQTRPARVLRTQ